MPQQTNPTDLHVEVTLDVPVERAFAAFTERPDEWWPRAYRLGASERTGLTIERAEGGRWYEIGADDTTTDWGQVLAWQPTEHVALGWQITPAFGPEPDPAKASRVDVRFTAEGAGKTQVVVVHSGFERHGEGWESMRQGVDGDGGWPGILAAFAEVAATS